MPTILVVDDDADTCSNMADLFGDLGYAIETAEDGNAALEKARQQSYDLGLLDLRMPGMDGLTLCRHLKQLQPPMVTMIVTRPVAFDKQAYRRRSIIEQLIGWLKESRRIFSRFEKTATNFAGTIKMAFIHRYLRLICC